MSRIALINSQVQTIINEVSDIGSCLRDFRILKELGRGSFGVVYLAKPLSNTTVSHCVIKQICFDSASSKQKLQTLDEVHNLKKLQHANVIKYFGSFFERQNLFIVMEYAEKGDLQQIIARKKQQNKYLSEQEIWAIAF
jgi:NIMA (never in mitosis gene a)-related kinase